MKKILAFILTAALMLTCLTACDMLQVLFEKDKNVTCQEYENCAVFTFDDFPSRTTASFELNRTDLGEGAIYYQVNLEAGSLSVSYKHSVINVFQPLGDFTADDEMPINGSGGYVEGNKITITFESDSPVKGEIIIAFTEEALKAVHGNLQLHTHTYSYISAGEVGHYTTFTCGCDSEEGTTPHYDGDTDYLCDFCKCDMTEFADEWQYDETHHWWVSNNDGVYCYAEHENWDADLNCDICGYRVDPHVPTNHFLRNQAGCEWMNEITAEDVSEIKIIEEAVGVAPGTPKNVSSSTDESVIARIFEEYYWLDTTPISKADGQIDGGGCVTVNFILKDGTERKLYINNGIYCDTNDNYFELLFTPKFNDTDDAIKTYGFINYVGTGTVYDGNNNPICEIPVDDLGFIITGYDFSLFDNGYDYYIETEFGKLYFVRVEIVASEGGGHELDRVDYYFIVENDTEFCYRLAGKNLDELIEEYSCIAE